MSSFTEAPQSAGLSRRSVSSGRRLRRHLRSESQPPDPVQDEIDPDQEPHYPEAGERPTCENYETGNDAEDPGDEKHPACLGPVAESDEDADGAGSDQEYSEEPCQDQHTGNRLVQKHDAGADVEKAEDDLPDEPAPALGPERMNDLENARDDSNPAQEEDADKGRQGHVS